ncbi:MAG: high-potential iron-sulfur protein [Burkholderiaceae bacterium]|nr:MAG: High potential iron-sulfur protein [Burkholderiaceae bacterium]MBE7425941.1 high-potential iron-sulfur protein [Ideonella sp.]MCC7284757.1 high-potential iron-sulfur protein [Burkholderiaceae bacterium]
MNSPSSTRRGFLALVGSAGPVIWLASLPRSAQAAPLPHLTVAASPTAAALKYTEDASKAGAPHKPGQDCSNCQHYQGKAGQAYGPCALFPGFDVNAKGWCAGYGAKA